LHRFAHVDWNRLYKVLLVEAKVRLRNAPDSFDCGISAEDLVGETLTDFFNSAKALGWKPGKEALNSPSEAQRSLEKFLAGVLRHKAIDHLRRQKHVAGSIDDPDKRFAEGSNQQDATAQIDYVLVRDKIYELLKHDKELIDLVAATELVTGEYPVNQELAEILGKTTREIVNLKRRLQSMASVRELLYGRS
jgi:DNA-directed RNA polymerase specialized sigma24 family protein